MAPNTVDLDPNLLTEKTKTRDEIFYNGNIYDVTNFIANHPGGNVLRFYTEIGEDASQAIEQFHYRSRNKVTLILKSLKQRPASLQEHDLISKSNSHYNDLTKDFWKLFEELQAEGYFEPSITHVILRLAECLGLTLVSLSIFFHCQNTWEKFLSTIFVGFVLSRYGWVQHEGGHNSLTGHPKVDKWIQTLCMSLVAGVSGTWWNSQHNRHHAMPQRLKHDVDLATLPFVAFHTRTVTKANDINWIFVRFQGIFYWTVDLFLVAFLWKFYLHPRYLLHKKAYNELTLGMLNIIACFVYIGPVWHFTIGYWATFFLGINFALNHSHLDVADKPTHWAEYGLTHTANIKSSMFVDYFMGYLNFQIEHHLFPTMPQFRLKQICPRVKALAEKYGLPYSVYRYPEAVRLAISNLHSVGKQLTDYKN